MYQILSKFWGDSIHFSMHPLSMIGLEIVAIVYYFVGSLSISARQRLRKRSTETDSVDFGVRHVEQFLLQDIRKKTEQEKTKKKEFRENVLRS